MRRRRGSGSDGEVKGAFLAEYMKKKLEVMIAFGLLLFLLVL
jgi:hypothetical protein